MSKPASPSVRRFAAFALAGSLACSVLACNGCVQPSSDNTASSATATASSTRTVSVSASSSVEVAPDMAEISLTIAPQADTADGAQTAAAVDLNDLIAALGGVGVPTENVVSSQVSINAQYDWSDSVQRVSGYEAYVSVTVKRLAVTDAADVIAAAARVADTTVGGISYYVSDYDARYQDALTSAMDMARTKAEVLAQAAGQSLGQAVDVDEGRDAQNYRSTDAVAYAATDSEEAATGTASAKIDINPGTVSIQADVSVSYELV